MAVVNPAGKSGDGKAVNVDLTSSVEKGDIVYAQGWLGVAGSAGDSGDTIALTIAPFEFSFHVGTLDIGKGEIAYVDPTALTGHLPTLSGWDTTGGGGKIPLFKATSDKNSDNYIYGILLTEGWVS